MIPIKAWLQLLRVPNLFTVPGDAIAGYAMGAIFCASQVVDHRVEVPVPFLMPAILAGLASLFLYSSGLLSNDLFDLSEDRRERPQRPLPSGAVSPTSAWMAAFALSAAGIAVAAFAGGAITAQIAAILAAIILIYNVGAKRIPVAGPLLMGLCRGLSCTVGISIGASWHNWGDMFILRNPVGLVALGYALGLTLYIAAVTAVAAVETQPGALRFRRFLPITATVVWLVMINSPMLFAMLSFVPYAVMDILAIGWVIRCTGALGGRAAPHVVQRTIGQLIRVLLLVQVSIVLLASAANPKFFIVMGALIVFWPLSAILGRRFYAS